MPDRPVRIAVVMACYNRRDTTLRCLRSLFAQLEPTVSLDVYLLDDASSDGTGAAVRAEFPNAECRGFDSPQPLHKINDLAHYFSPGEAEISPVSRWCSSRRFA
ncbi:MAG: glycosyltransferase [Alphaproteobacteria bacterium]|nr:glycosyltransferase [Alphaproteobacteria bacterium]